MSTKAPFALIVVLAALLLISCSTQTAVVPLSPPESAQRGDFSGLQPCQFKPVGSNAELAAECGTLVVPENWDKADSRLIALPVVRVPATGSSPAEPIFLLEGGPGGPNLEWAPPDWILRNHDVVMVGYRGVEGTVTLACPEVDRVAAAHLGRDLFSDATRGDLTAATKECAVRLQAEGIDLSGYTIPGVVEDMEAARKALGYDRIDLYSRSYGTRVAQIYAYMHPNSLHRLVLIGVNTPGHFVWDRQAFDKMIQHISELCGKDPACSRRTNDLAETMYAVNHHMPTHWLFFPIDPGSIRMGTHVLLFSTERMPMIFDAYLAAGQGDPSGLALMNLVGRFMPPGQVMGDQLSKGGSADLEKYHGIHSVDLGDSIMGAPLAQEIWPMATVWPIQLIPQELREFQETNVEMLLVNGSIDFSTPPNALDEAKPYYHKAQMVLLPEFSHVHDVETLQPAAFERLITSYYDTGVADRSLFVYQPLSLKPGISLAVVAKVLVAAMFLLPALMALGIVLAVRRIRGRRMTRSGTAAG